MIRKNGLGTENPCSLKASMSRQVTQDPREQVTAGVGGHCGVPELNPVQRAAKYCPWERRPRVARSSSTFSREVRIADYNVKALNWQMLATNS